MDCIQQRNPYAGFINQHHVSCHYCDEPAEWHYNLDYACGNVCEKCARKFRKESVDEGIYIPNREGGESEQTIETT